MKDMDMLLKTGKKVWFYLKDQQTQGIFAKEVTRLGGCYGDGTPVRAENCATVMAVRPNLEVARVQLLIWDASFREDFAARYLADASSILKVDYAKFLAGAEDYVCAGSAEGAVPQQTFSGSSGVSGAVRADGSDAAMQTQLDIARAADKMNRRGDDRENHHACGKYDLPGGSGL